MAFTTEQPKYPASIGRIVVVLVDNPGSTTDTVQYDVEILGSDGELFDKKTGDLVPHLTQGQIDALIAFMGVLRTKANNELLP